jgi:type IV pilus assembly protein PilQ
MSGTQFMKTRIGTGKMEQMVHACCMAMLLAMLSAIGNVRAADDKPGPQLDDIQFSSLSGNRVQVELVMTGPVNEPRSFTTDTPARIALDFPQTTSNLTKKTFSIGVGVVRSVAAVQGKDRTRVVVDLVKMVPYQTRVEGNHFFIIVEGGDIAATTAPVAAAATTEGTAPASPAPVNQIESVDFRRGTKGEGRILVNLSNAAIPVNIHQEGDKIVVDFAGAGVPKELQRRLDVVDFATPVTMVDTFAVGKDTRMVISATGNFEHLAYQAERQFTVEVKPVTKAAQEAQKKDELGYTGEKLSLNFQDIEVRAALQIIADFTGLNMVVSDTVKGSISLRLKDVPWDQALDIILKTKSLGVRKMGNVLMVAPSAEISAREKDELEAQKKISELEPMHSELIQINYAKAADIANFIRSKASTGTAPAGGAAGGGGGGSTSLLSERGTVTVDERTNSLLIQDTASRLTEIRKMVAQLDIPVRQVLIESRIVIANDDFSRDLGTRFGVTNVSKNGNSGVVSVTGNANGNDTVVNSAISNVNSSGQPFPVTMPALDNRLNVNLPVASPAGSIGLAILGKNSLVDLELSALQAEGRGEVVSNPRVITANQKEATIEQGVEIPYQEASSSGATSVSFKKAVLSLKVTPQITPDDRVIMDLNVTKDSVGQVFAGVPSINTREINTQVLVENGETVVLGGIYEQTRSKDVTKVPLLGDLPYVGALFRSTSQVDDKVELLIFVTPKILKESLGAH